MPYKTFFNWCFNGRLDSPIPRGEDVPDILKYNSPINITFLLKSFIKNGKLNHYLDQYVNHIGGRYIEREDLFLFFKKCVIDFKIRRKDVHFSPFNRRDALFNLIRKKLPLLKIYEIELICSVIDSSSDKEKIYKSYGLQQEKKKNKKKVKTNKKYTEKLFIKENFNMIKYEGVAIK